MKLTYDQRQALIGKSFVSNMNHPVESSVTVHDVERCGGWIHCQIHQTRSVGRTYLLWFTTVPETFPT